MSENVAKILSTDVSGASPDELQSMLDALQSALDSEQLTDEERAQVEAKIDEIKNALEKSASVDE